MNDIRTEQLASAPPAPPQRPINYISALTILLGWQLAGEACAALLRQLSPNLIIPGAVLGMVFCFLYLLRRKGPDPSLEATSTSILGNLSLLFIPAAVGVIQHGHILSQFGLVLAVALVVSTLLTLVVTAGTFLLVSRTVARHGN